MKITEYMKDHVLYLDGGMGTLLQAEGLRPGEYPERWNLARPETIIALQRAYFDAGSNVVAANTFGANPLKFAPDELEALIAAAVSNAREASRRSSGGQPKWVALDVGPTGRLLRPYGDFDFEDAVSAFARTVRVGVRQGVDLILIETMNDSYETKAALLAAKENSDLPVFVSNAYGGDGRLMTGATPAAMVALLEGMGADAIGVNCSLGPKQLAGVVDEYLRHASVPVLVKPNAGLPRVIDGRTVYDVKADEFAWDVAGMIAGGVRVAGGCCGTTPEYIRLLVERSRSVVPAPIVPREETVVSCNSRAVAFGGAPLLIGERINPTGKKRLRQALRENDMDYILSEGLAQQERGVHILDVNVGLPEIDEPVVLRDVVCELQAVVDLPLQIDSSDPAALEQALRRCNGKAMVNSVNGKRESMEAVFPLVKKYGGVVVALTLDEDGIPDTAAGRFAIAEKILRTAAEHGVARRDVVFDTLAMTVSAAPEAAGVTLEALRRIRGELGCHTVLGVSNVSFGLPNRDVLNGAFFAMALASGLSAAIMNPNSAEMMKTYRACLALKGLDENFAGYLAFCEGYAPEAQAPAAARTAAPAAPDAASELQAAIVKGLRDRAGELAAALAAGGDPLRLIQEEIIPALDVVGRGFEDRTVYLPQLLMSAEAAKSAFERLRAGMPAGEDAAARGPFVLATVQGDIHDIGKNIVRLLLENYGFRVIDLGKDVPPEAVVEAVLRHRAPVAGLSALMTTTVPAMERTIRLLRERAPWCRVVVGGAVLNQDYADQIGADRYAREAMDTVRYAEAVVDAGEAAE